MRDTDLPKRVRDARRRQGWTQEDVAEKAGMKLRAYQNFEGGHSWPQPANLRGILIAVGLDAAGEEHPEAPRVVAGTEWPRDVDVFLSMLGAFLMTMTEDQRLGVIHDLTRQVFEANRRQPD